jgi:hypothetical protein
MEFAAFSYLIVYANAIGEPVVVVDVVRLRRLNTFASTHKKAAGRD